jgi:hypothetical protein
MKSTLLGAALAFALLFVGIPAFTLSATSASAQDKVCSYYYDSTVEKLGALTNVVIEEIPAEDMAAFMVYLEEHLGHKFGVIPTRAFVMSVYYEKGGELFNKIVGLEINGCLSDPIKVDLTF